MKKNDTVRKIVRSAFGMSVHEKVVPYYAFEEADRVWQFFYHPNNFVLSAQIFDQMHNEILTSKQRDAINKT